MNDTTQNDTTHNVRSMPISQRQTLSRQSAMALQRDPKNVEAMLALSAIEIVESNNIGAASWLKKALALRKKDPDILLRLASLYETAKDFRNARKYGRKLCEVQPRKAGNYQFYGGILEEAGDPQGAIRAYKTALRLQPGDAATLNAIARCHGFQGNHEESRRVYEAALAVSPDNPRALYGLANSTRVTPEEAAALLERLEKAATSQTEKDEVAEAALLYFSAGKVAADTGEHSRAFEYYSRANATVRPENELNLHKNVFDNVEKAFTPALMKAKKGCGHDSGAPVFIIGMPRSGTTLTESICAAHSKVTARDELPYISNICAALGAEHEETRPFIRAIGDIPQHGAKAMAEDYLDKAIGPEGLDTPHFTDKMPHNFRYAGFIAIILPQAPIIHVRRHPLDNCFSIFSNNMSKFHNSYKTDLVWLGLYYRRYARLMKHWKALLPGHIHDVFYEDLVANTELNARRLIERIGLEWEKNVMDRSGSQRSVRTLSQWQVRQPVYDSSKGRWRRYEKELAPLIEILAPVIEEYEAELEQLASADEDAST